MRRRGSSRWRRLPVLVVVLSLVLPSVTVMREPILRLGAQSLVNEWRDCLLHDEAPGPQPAVAAAAARLRTPSPASDDAHDPPIALPVIRPAAQLRATVAPNPDRPATLPRPVVVAVLDTGVTATHRDVQADRVLPGVDLLNPCGDGRQDVTGHGTAVAGVLLSNHHGGAPGVDVLPIRISLATGRHASMTSALGIVVATRRGADIINMSYTTQRARPSVLEWLAVRYAHRRGVALVAAAGNDPSRPAGYPAAYREVLSVTATDKRGELSSFSARAGKIDVAAPGSRVLTLASNGSMRTASGTSLAAPLVSASLVHLLRADPSLTPDRAVAIVRDTTGPPPVEVPDGPLLAYRIGTLNFAAALTGVCAITAACQVSVAADASGDIPPVGDPRRTPVPGELQ